MHQRTSQPKPDFVFLEKNVVYFLLKTLAYYKTSAVVAIVPRIGSRSCWSRPNSFLAILSPNLIKEQVSLLALANDLVCILAEWWTH
jgi:hypothetical protein